MLRRGTFGLSAQIRELKLLAGLDITGYHCIEKDLFQCKTTKGIKPFAEKLQKDGLDREKRIATLIAERKVWLVLLLN